MDSVVLRTKSGGEVKVRITSEGGNVIIAATSGTTSFVDDPVAASATNLYRWAVNTPGAESNSRDRQPSSAEEEALLELTVEPPAELTSNEGALFPEVSGIAAQRVWQWDVVAVDIAGSRFRVGTAIDSCELHLERT